MDMCTHRGIPYDQKRQIFDWLVHHERESVQAQVVPGGQLKAPYRITHVVRPLRQYLEQY